MSMEKNEREFKVEDKTYVTVFYIVHNTCKIFIMDY